MSRWRAVARHAGIHLWILARRDGYPVMAAASPALENSGGIYLSAGIHGDEAGATEGLVLWAERHTQVLASLPCLILPCLNPWGLVNNSRLDASGADLNRAWRDSDDEVLGAEKSQTSLRDAARGRLGQGGRRIAVGLYGIILSEPQFEPNAVTACLPASRSRWLVIFSGLGAVISRIVGCRFRLALTLHEDYDAQGLYIYELRATARHDGLGETLIASVRHLMPPDPRPLIDGRKASGGLIRPRLNRQVLESQPEAVFLHLHHAECSFTFETPSECDISLRAETQAMLIKNAVDLTTRG